MASSQSTETVLDKELCLCGLWRQIDFVEILGSVGCFQGLGSG